MRRHEPVALSPRFAGHTCTIPDSVPYWWTAKRPTWMRPRAFGVKHWAALWIPIIQGPAANYRMLDTPPDEPIVQIQRVEHESRVHLDIETDDIPAEVERLTKLGATVVDRLERWVVMQAPTGQRFCVVRIQRPGFPKNANRWD